MNIKHIYHSGFQIEFGDKIILIDVFDYFETLENKKYFASLPMVMETIFLKKIFDLASKNDVTYILSDDIETNYPVDYYVQAGDCLTIEDMKLEVFGSTDLGVSLYLEANGHTFFHSGDLNWWHWTSFSPDQLENEARDFKKIVDALEDKNIDFYFVPVDDRLKPYDTLAIEYVVNKLQPQYVIPMHFKDHFDAMESLTLDGKSKLLKSHKINDVIYSK